MEGDESRDPRTSEKASPIHSIPGAVETFSNGKMISVWVVFEGLWPEVEPSNRATQNKLAAIRGK
jgi:hypothetical protein